MIFYSAPSYDHLLSISRHELHKLVWSEPITRLAKTYGFSDVWLAKICKKYSIPRPGRGYWARKKAGERVAITRLPKPSDNPVINIITHPEKPKTSRERKGNPFVERIPKKIVVPDTLREPHALINETARILASSKENDSGILTPSKAKGLDIRVSRECLDRALRIMDTLIKALTEVGFTVSVSGGATWILVGDVYLKISLQEELKRRRLKAAEHDLDGYYRFGYNLYADRAVPSGSLSLMIDDQEVRYHMASRRTWRDSETRRLEDCLRSFIYGLIKAMDIKSNLKQKEAASNQASHHSSEDDASEHL
jgi:hypothetical protein